MQQGIREAITVLILPGSAYRMDSYVRTYICDMPVQYIVYFY